MDPRSQAIEIVKTLALEGRPVHRIDQELDDLGLGGALHPTEIERILIEVEAARAMIPPRPSRNWPRAVGIISILVGSAALPLGGGIGRYSPAGYGCLAILLGLVLILRPDWSDTEMD